MKRSAGPRKKAVLICALLLAALPPAARAQDAIDRFDMKAHAAFDARNYDLAIQCWSEALKLDPNNSGIHYNRSLAYQARGDIPAALADCDAAVQLDSSDAATFDQRSRLYLETARIERSADKPFVDDVEKAVADCTEAIHLRLGNTDDPKAALEKLKTGMDDAPLQRAAYASEMVKLDPRDATARFNLANEELEMGDTARSMADRDQAIALDPANPVFIEARGKAFLDQSGNKFGSELYNKALADYAESLRLTVNSMQDPKEWLKQKAQNSVHRTEKFACAEALVKLDPKDPDAYEMRATLRLDIARDAPGREWFRQSVDDFHEAFKLRLQGIQDPKGWIREQIFNYQEEGSQDDTCKAMTFASCEALIELDPKDAGAWITKAAAYEFFHARDDVIASYTEAIRLDPKNAGAYRGRASAYAEKQEDLTKTIADYNTIILITPAHAPDNINAHFDLGGFYKSMGDYGRSVEEFSAAIADRKDILIYNSRASVYMKLRKWDDAYADYSEAIKLSPDWAGEPYVMRAEVSYYQQDWDKATADLDTAIVQYNKMAQRLGGPIPKDAWWYEWIAIRACVSYHMKQWGPALQGFEALAEKNQNGPSQPSPDATRFIDAFHPQVLKGEAWIYATCPDDQFRSGAKAVDLATQLCTLSQWTNADDIDTLAAALAENQKWDDAIKYENLALKIDIDAGADKNKYAIVAMKARLSLYQQKIPCRESKELLATHSW